MLVSVGYSQNPIQVNFSPNGVLDNVLDQYGNHFRLQDILIDETNTLANKTELINCTSTSNFNLYFEDGSGMEIVTDPIQNAINSQRRAVVCQVFQDLSAFINTPLTSSGNRVNIWIRNINNFGLSTNGLLGIGSGFYVLPSNNTVGGIADNEIWKTIHTGVDSYANVTAPLSSGGGTSTTSGIFYHGYLAINFNTNNSPAINWNTNTGILTPSGMYDLYSVVLHEMTHALGINTSINENGTSRFNNVNFNYFSRYDQFLRSNNDFPLLVSSGNSSMYNASFNNTSISTAILHPGCSILGNINTGSISDNTICNNAIKYHGSINDVPVYTPVCYEVGSSLCHFEDQLYPSCTSPYGNNSYFLLSNAGSTGITKRFLQAEERNTLCDIGYSTNISYGVSGAHIDGNNNSHNYGVTSACTGITVAGINDGINSDNSYTYITNLNTNITINISTLIANDPNATGIEGLEDISIFVPQTPAIPNSILLISGNTLTFSSGNSGLHLLRYVPTNGAEKGNITYVYIYINEPIISCQSIPNTCDLVINGDFEQNVPYYGSNSNDNINLNCGWKTLCGTPDRYRTVAPDAILQIPCNFHGYQYDATTSAGNRSYVGLGNIRYSATSSIHEIIKTKLKTPLIAGVTYQLSFNVSLSESWSASSIKMQACVSSVDYSLSGEGFDFAIPSGIILTSAYQSNNMDGWNTESFTFTASGGEEYLYLGGLQFQNLNFTLNNPVNSIPNCSVPSYSNINSSSYQASYNYIDNVSLIPVSGTIALPTSMNCGSPIITNLAILIDGMPSNGVFSGLGVTLSPTTGFYSFNPALAGTGTIAITYTYNGGGCPISVINNIVVNTASILPTFATIPSICSGALFNLPTTSLNGISGTWSPAFNNLATTTYTFTPNSNTCGIPTTLTVVISNNPNVTPIFSTIASICYGEVFTLPTTSTNGIVGTWSPTINNLQTTTYTFTPNNGVCANTTTITIIVNPLTITITGAVGMCLGNLEVYSSNGVGGNWSSSNTAIADIDAATGEVSANQAGVFDVIYTLISGSCTTSASLQVTVFDRHIQPIFSFPTTICTGTTPPILPHLSNDGVPGDWIPSTVDNTHTANYLFKPTNHCNDPFTQTITVIHGGTLIANQDTMLLPFSVTGFVSPNFLLNDTFNGTLLTSNSLGLTIGLVSTTNNSITINQDGTLNIPPDLPIGTYSVEYKLTNNCLQSGLAKINITIYNATIDASTKGEFEVCYNPNAYTTTQSILERVSVGGLRADASNIEITNTNFPVGFTVNGDGTVNIPLGTLPGTYYLNYDLCPLGSLTGCVTTIKFQVVVATTVTTNPDVFYFDTNGNFLGSNNSSDNNNILTNDGYAQDCGFSAPNSFGPVVLGGNGNVSNLSINLGSSAPNFFINPNGFVSSYGAVNIGTYPFTYTICDADYQNIICSATYGWIEVISNAKMISYNNGVKENEIVKITISPNPSDGMFYLNFNNMEVSVSVYNQIGQLIFNDNNIITENYELNLSNYPTGTYLLKISYKGKIIGKKIILK